MKRSRAIVMVELVVAAILILEEWQREKLKRGL
jgi:hypothetical protein